jgi:hypothetical protein
MGKDTKGVPRYQGRETWVRKEASEKRKAQSGGKWMHRRRQEKRTNIVPTPTPITSVIIQGSSPTWLLFILKFHRLATQVEEQGMGAVFED